MVMMSLRRRVMGGKKSLPYDAEIEYLESSGTQYIDTGIKVTSNPKAVVELMQVTTQDSDYWGNSFPSAYVNTDGMFSAHFFYGGITVWRYGNQRKEPGISFRVDLNVKLKIETGKKVILNDGEQEVEMSNDFVYSPDQKNIDIFRSRETSYSSWKLYTFKLYDAGELVRDYIPVRVGTTGYLYDKVSGELFGNQGTGDFILGPDIKDYSEEYLTFEALENSTFKLTGNDIEYSIDGGSTWATLPAGTDSPVISVGNTIMWRRISSYVYEGTGTFSSTGNYIVYGNSMSIVYGSDYIEKTSFGGNYVFKFLFKGDTHIISAHDMILPAITLTGACYYQMFMGCSNLIDAPDLPFTSLTGYEQCLQMFSGCVNLQTPIVLLPETLMRNSYFAMFQNCQKINDVTIMATDISANNCLYLWLTGVAASGTITKRTGVTYPSGSSGIPNGWTVIEI